MFFDPDETLPELTDEESEALNKAIDEQINEPLDCLMNEAQGYELTEDSFEDTRAYAHIFKKVVDFMDIFFSESERDKTMVKFAFSDTVVDQLYEAYERDGTPNAFCHAQGLLFLVSRLVQYQCRSGGRHLIDCLDRTVKAFDKLFELWQRIYIRYPDRAKITNELMVNLVTFSAYPYMQVGDRKRFAEITRLEYKLASKMDLQFYKDVESDSGVMDKTDEEIWQEFRRHGRYRLACINCGEFEKKGKKHNRCGSCSNALYCSKECQVLHWKQHKADCRANSAPGRKKSAKQRS
uniref:MYND-type domain-containing protein n=1 Tax=Leptocylindrus danicus TaxID=163516 RepID=A0A7S2K460_9STRA